MGTRNALALARSNLPTNGDSGLQMTEQQNGNNVHPDNDQPAGREEPRYTHGGVFDQYHNTPAEPETAHVQHQQPYYEGYDPNSSPIVSRDLTTSPTQMQEHQYADLSLALATPPPTHSASLTAMSPFNDTAALTSAYVPAPGHEGGTSLQATYDSFDAQNAVPSHPTRTGTPVDPNPQQTYLAPGQDPFGSRLHPLRNVVSANDTYGGV